MKRILSLFLTAALLISSSTVVFAAELDNMSLKKSSRVTIGEYQYEVIDSGSEIIVNEYDGNTIISKTTNVLDSDIIVKENYNNNSIVDSSSTDSNSVETFEKSDMLSEAPLSNSQMEESRAAAASWKTYGKYSIQLKNLTGQTKNFDALLKYYISSEDDESFTVKAKYHDEVAVLISFVGGIVGGLFTGGATIAGALVAAVITTSGSLVVDGIIQTAFTESVAAYVTHYKTKYTDTSGSGSGSTFSGTKAKITTRVSSNYNKTFYDGDAPQRYKENALKACLNSYTGGNNYSYNKMLSFNVY